MIRSALFFAATFIGTVLVASVCPAYTVFSEVDHLYQSFDELQSWLTEFEAEFGTEAGGGEKIVKVVEYGQSHQGRTLWAIKISRTPDANNPAKPEFLFTGGVHAREVIGSEACYRLAQHIAGGYRAGDTAMIDILDEREVWILPNMNPDGRIRVEGGYSRQRKTMQLFPYQNPDNYQRGVDLNRNFPHRWSSASSSVSSEQYRGKLDASSKPGTAESTPEATTFWTMLHNDQYFSDIRAAIDFHSGIQSILTPWISAATSTTSTVPQADREKFDELAGVMNAITGLVINDLNYNAYGTLTDSLYDEFGAYALCEELYRGPVPVSNYFAYFNPVDQSDINTAVDVAIKSSMFLLSDEAFGMIPEPSVWVMLFLGGIAVFLARKPVPLAASRPPDNV